jgi:HEPN domain-containing protein
MAEVGSYLYIAERDLKDARHLFNAKSYTSCGRFCEQAAEKAFKHFIHLKGASEDYKLLSVHKPVRLYSKCVEYLLDIELSADEALTLAKLDDYYYDTNYPGNAFFELDEASAKAALILADKIVNHVTNKTKA